METWIGERVEIQPVLIFKERWHRSIMMVRREGCSTTENSYTGNVRNKCAQVPFSPRKDYFYKNQ